MSWKTAQPKYQKLDKHAQEAWQEGFKKADDLDDEYTNLTICQTRQLLSEMIHWVPRE